MSGPAVGQKTQRVSRRRLMELATRLSLADFDTIGLLAQHRFLTTGHMAGLVYAAAASRLAGVRAAQRALRKLEQAGLVAVLPRRVGGYGGGTTQSVWRLSEAGHRLLRLQTKAGTRGSGDKSRARFVEPSTQFLAHTLRIGDIRLVFEQLHTESGGTVELSLVQVEPDCWRTWTGPYGAKATLRPDLYAETTSSEFVDLWFIEADLSSEHLPAIARKARVYEAYRRTGREQTDRGAFPLVLWVTPDTRRAEAILAAIDGDSGCDGRLHRAVAIADLTNYLTKKGGDL